MVAFGEHRPAQHNWLVTINPVPSTDSEVLTGNIHSRQFLRGMHINRIQTSMARGGGQLFQSEAELSHKTGELHYEAANRATHYPSHNHNLRHTRLKC